MSVVDQPTAAVRLAYGCEPSQFGDLRLPTGSGPHAVLMVIHGGRWQANVTLDGIAAACASVTDAGVATWNVEYRRLGIDGGGWPGTFQDVASALDHLRSLAREYSLDLDRVVALGHSAGGPLALWLAGRYKIPAGDPLHSPNPLRPMSVISSAGVNDFRRAYETGMGEGVMVELLGGAPEQVPDRYATTSPVDLLPLGVPQLLIHGTADDMVNHADSERYRDLAAAAGDQVRLVSVPGSNHFGIRDPQTPFWALAREAILSTFSR